MLLDLLTAVVKSWSVHLRPLPMCMTPLGLEPKRPKAADFKSAVFTNYNHEV